MPKTLAGHTGGEGTTVGRVSLVSPRTGLTELTHKSLGTGALLHPGGGPSVIKALSPIPPFFGVKVQMLFRK